MLCWVQSEEARTADGSPTIGVYKAAAFSPAACGLRLSFSPLPNMFPHFFQSIAYDRGTRWGRKHQTYDDLGIDRELPERVDLRDRVDNDGIEVYDQVPPSLL